MKLLDIFKRQKWIDDAGFERKSERERDEYNRLYAEEAEEEAYIKRRAALGKPVNIDEICAIYGVKR